VSIISHQLNPSSAQGEENLHLSSLSFGLTQTLLPSIFTTVCPAGLVALNGEIFASGSSTLVFQRKAMFIGVEFDLFTVYVFVE